MTSIYEEALAFLTLLPGQSSTRTAATAQVDSLTKAQVSVLRFKSRRRRRHRLLASLVSWC